MKQKDSAKCVLALGINVTCSTINSQSSQWLSVRVILAACAGVGSPGPTRNEKKLYFLLHEGCDVNGADTVPAVPLVSAYTADMYVHDLDRTCSIISKCWLYAVPTEA